MLLRTAKKFTEKHETRAKLLFCLVNILLLLLCYVCLFVLFLLLFSFQFLDIPLPSERERPLTTGRREGLNSTSGAQFATVSLVKPVV